MVSRLSNPRNPVGRSSMGRLRSWAQVIRAVVDPSEHLPVDSADPEVRNEDLTSLRSAEARNVHSPGVSPNQPRSRPPAATPASTTAKVDGPGWDVVETSRNHFTR